MAFDFEFTPQVDVTRNTLITSNVRTLQGITGSILVSVTGVDAQLIIDGAPMSGTQPLINGQTIQIGLRSSAFPGNIEHAIVDFGGIYESAFSVMTAAAARDQVLNGQEGNTTVEFSPPYPGGTALEQANKITSITDAGAFINTSIVQLDTPLPANLGDAADYLYVADFHNNRVHRLDDNMDVVHSIVVPRPFDVAFTPTEIIGGMEVDILCTDPISHKVRTYRRGLDYSLSQTTDVGNTPMGLVGVSSALDPAVISFYVACRGDDTVEKWSRPAAGGPYTKAATFTLPGGSKPTNLWVAPDGIIYVTLVGSGEIARIEDGQSPVMTYVGQEPMSIAGNSTMLYVTCQGVDAIVPVDITSGMTAQVPKQTDAIVAPMAIALHNDILTVGGIDSGTVERYTASTMAYLDTVNCGNHIIGAYPYKNHTRVVSMYANGAKRTGQLGVIPAGFGVGMFPEPVGIPNSVTVDSSTVTIAGLDSSTLIHVPNIWNATIVVNGAPQGVSAIVENGDSMFIRVTMSSNDADVINIPITTVGSGFNWSVTGITPDPTPVTGYISGG